MDDDLFTETTDDESGLFPGSAGDLPTPNLRLDPTMPLAARMRPRDLSEYVGQGHILGEGKLLRRAIEADRFTSLIFYGPPGVGKTSLAELIARRTESRFINLSGVESNVAEIRRAVEAARQFQRTRGEITTLFVDEIHRFNKSQQDVLLPHIERGTVRFIGATTHNPYFYINSPLVSRSQVFRTRIAHPGGSCGPAQGGGFAIRNADLEKRTSSWSPRKRPAISSRCATATLANC